MIFFIHWKTHEVSTKGPLTLKVRDLLRFRLSRFLKLQEIAGRCKAPVPLGRIFFPIVHDRDKFNNREQSETNRNYENAICDYLSDHLRMCSRLYEDHDRF